ncbi:MAG: 30S ribosomal protein S15 [Candidatus Aenigmatarchaeota archaeon]|nr:MAG: 30S ribosomal protein S15 [Candidatus Aenigmarchaeota archaeon]
MARMHSGKHGKSRSKRPIRKTVPKWVRYKPDEVEKLVLKLAKEGRTSAQIGTLLRDEYGVPHVKEITGKRLVAILAAHDLEPQLPEDLFSLMKRAVHIMEHLVKHKHDPFAIHGLELTESKIRRLGKYYKRKGRLPETWAYDREQARLLVK